MLEDLEALGIFTVVEEGLYGIAEAAEQLFGGDPSRKATTREGEREIKDVPASRDGSENAWSAFAEAMEAAEALD